MENTLDINSKAEANGCPIPKEEENAPGDNCTLTYKTAMMRHRSPKDLEVVTGDIDSHHAISLLIKAHTKVLAEQSTQVATQRSEFRANFNVNEMLKDIERHWQRRSQQLRSKIEKLIDVCFQAAPVSLASRCDFDGDVTCLVDIFFAKIGQDLRLGLTALACLLMIARAFSNSIESDAHMRLVAQLGDGKPPPEAKAFEDEYFCALVRYFFSFGLLKTVTDEEAVNIMRRICDGQARPMATRMLFRSLATALSQSKPLEPHHHLVKSLVHEKAELWCDLSKGEMRILLPSLIPLVKNCRSTFLVAKLLSLRRTWLIENPQEFVLIMNSIGGTNKPFAKLWQLDEFPQAVRAYILNEFALATNKGVGEFFLQDSLLFFLNDTDLETFEIALSMRMRQPVGESIYPLITHLTRQFLLRDSVPYRNGRRLVEAVLKVFMRAPEIATPVLIQMIAAFAASETVASVGMLLDPQFLWYNTALATVREFIPSMVYLRSRMEIASSLQRGTSSTGDPFRIMDNWLRQHWGLSDPQQVRTVCTLVQMCIPIMGNGSISKSSLKTLNLDILRRLKAYLMQG